MTKPAMIRQIFAELRNTLGPETPTYELLECASLIADANDNPLNRGAAFLSDGKSPFCELPVDQVIGTLAWELVEHDYRSTSAYGNENQDDYMAHVPQEFVWEQLLAA
jgi:hypothetical protein